MRCVPELISVLQDAAEVAVPEIVHVKEKKKKKDKLKVTVEGGVEKKEKKKKKRAKQNLEVEEPDVTENGAAAAVPETKEDKKESKKRKKLLAAQQENGDHGVAQEEEGAAVAKLESEPTKKKKKKRKEVQEDKENGCNHIQLSPVPISDTKELKAPSSAPAALLTTPAQDDDVPKQEKSKKKKAKKSKKLRSDDEAACVADVAVAAPAELPEACTPALAPAAETVDTPMEPESHGVEDYDAEDYYDEGETQQPNAPCPESNHVSAHVCLQLHAVVVPSLSHRALHLEFMFVEQQEAPAHRGFRRVKSEEWIGKKGSMKNSYEATFGNSGWGAKAQQVLGATRGKGFRHEKTKKKRGNYMGGKIDSSARASFKYDSD